MTCGMASERLDAWLAGTLNDADARTVEEHAAGCPSCEARLEAANHLGRLPREISPPPPLRAVTMHAVARRRVRRNWRRLAVGGSAVAAIALLLLIGRPATKSARDVPRAGAELVARTHARPEFAALDAAERDIEQALRDQPGDPDLNEALTRIRQQRAAIQQLVLEAKS
jgi:predicted anti-sigma-YlaC factor YlaD